MSAALQTASAAALLALATLAGCRTAAPGEGPGSASRVDGAAPVTEGLAGEERQPIEFEPTRPRLAGPVELRPAPLAPGQAGTILRCAKVLTMDDGHRVYSPGVIVVRDGRIEAVGTHCVVPAGFEVHDLPDLWALPGLVDLHTHVHGGGWGDINDMVLPVNPDLRSTPVLVPGNRYLRRAIAGGVTTLFGIPGSGTSMSGFGVLYKTKDSSSYAEVVLRDPGGLKIAQTHNPERNSGDLGATRAGLSWVLEKINDRALESRAAGSDDLVVANLERVHSKELPVLIHCAGIDGAASTARMWRGTYDTNSVLSHGSFDGWKAADYVAGLGMPVNHGPRTMDYFSSVEGRVVPSAAEYVEAGVPNFSLNTDSPVIPQEEFFLQGSMSARLGCDSYQMLRAVTIHPARAFGIGQRVGSLEPGKDADIVLTNGAPLDPRVRVELVWIDGELEYDRERDGQRF